MKGTGRRRVLALPLFTRFFLSSLWLRWAFVAVCGPPLVVASEGYFQVVAHGLLFAGASLVVERRV